jgi:hypothetical protein
MLVARTRFSWWRTPLLIGALALAPQLPAPAQAPARASIEAPARELLNSERIAASFGSYGVEVLEQNAAVRVSNLFSGTGSEKTCRTFAVVQYASPTHPELRQEHAAIVAGGSLGADFAARGWEVRKTHLYYGEGAASPKLAALMRVPAGATLAEHAYVLDVVKTGRAIEYAALVEIHHPDYLGLTDLAEIYGEVASVPRRELLSKLLATAAERAR